MAEFAHLHCHTEYSLLDGAIRIKDLCARSKELGMDACAITDHGNMYGAANFYVACKEWGLKPIIGCEVYVCQNYLDKSPETGKKRNHLILLAANNPGYHNLVKLVTHASLEGFYYKPRVDKNLLAKYSEGLICLSACLSGEIPAAILSRRMDLTKNLIEQYSAIFPGNFYLEIQANDLPEQKLVNDALLELAESEKLPLVATNDCHYLKADDAYAHEVLMCIQTGVTMDDPNRMRLDSNEFYYKTPDEMQKAFAQIPEALENTVKIASQCQVELDFGHHYFPVYPLPENSSLESEFRRLAEDGLKKRLENHPNRNSLDRKAYETRLEHELNVIIEMGFPGYFLIVQEFINWAKDHNIPVGPGRGSAAGSLVAWALRITNLDPLPYNLLFERFLNIERISLPDIDVDFCEKRRSEVIRHMVDRYGKDSVAQITTFGTMKARGVVRDVGRALGMSVAERDKIAKMVPDSLKMTIEKALEMEPRLSKLCEEDADIARLIDISRKLEGLARHASTHAAGLVVSDKPLEDYLPLYLGKRQEVVTQFDGPMTEKTGLVKFDFLGLKTMTLIQETLDNIRQNGKEVPDLDNLPLTDLETYELYSRGDTEGVFQVESAGMRQYLRMLKPSCFEDIIAMLALYRPGPLGSGMVDEFIKRKHGKVKVTYPHPSLENCLADTYGVIVYQEQVMQIAQIIANYTLGGADLLRRAMGKKKIEAMAKERSKFVDGASKNGIDEKKANEIFDLMEKFAEYGFNKSHSAAYALISYYTGWLKTHYKVEFMAALLSSEMGTQEKLLKYISACKDMGIPVLPPTVNESRKEFSAIGDKVVFGLGGIKNVGEEAIRGIIEAREEKGNFISLYDLCCRVNQRKMNKKVLESLIKGGACDCLQATRAAMLGSLEYVVAKAQKNSKNANSSQNTLLSFASFADPQNLPGIGIKAPGAEIPEMPDDQKLRNEKEALGFFLTSHPLQPFTHDLERLELVSLEGCQDKLPGSIVNVAILTTSVKEIITKAGKKLMAFVEVEDLTGHAEVTFFPKDYERARELLAQDIPLVLKARLEALESADEENEESAESGENAVKQIKLQGMGVRALTDVCAAAALPVSIRIPERHLTDSSLMILKQILSDHPGSSLVEAWIELENYDCKIQFGEKYKVKSDEKLKNALAAWAG